MPAASARCGALLMQPAAIKAWAAEVRAGQQWRLPDQSVDSRSRRRGATRRPKARCAHFLGAWGPEVAARGRRCDAARFRRAMRGDARGGAADHLLDHGALSRRTSSPRMKARGITWFATVDDGRRGAGRGGGRRRCDRRPGHGGGRPSRRLRRRAGREPRWSACSRCCRRSSTRSRSRWSPPAASPMRAASRRLCSSAPPPSQIGTGFLRCPEAKLPAAWADALGRTLARGTRCVTRAFSGRAGRSIATAYVRAAASAGRAAARALSGAARPDRRRCARPPPRTATSTACRPGPGNRPRWRAPSRPAKSCASSGRARRRCSGRAPVRTSPAPHPSRAARSRNALPITLTDDSAIAAAAMIGDSMTPKKG